MKKLILLLNLMTISQLGFGQTKMFVHTATTENISSAATKIDHPDLNGNPNAGIIVSHRWNGSGAPGIYNDHVSGVWYDNSTNAWYIFNEDLSPLKENSKYNVFIGDPDNFYVHQATSENITYGHETRLPNTYAEEYLFYNTLFTGVYNDKRYSWDMVDDNRYLYTPSYSNIPLNSTFLIYDPSDSDNVTLYNHITGSANIVNNWSIIDHPALNNNEDATFIFTHFFGIWGSSTEVDINKNLGVWYDGTNWAIYTEDQSPMPAGLSFDILIADNEMSTNDAMVKEEMKVSPNPVSDLLTIQTSAQVEKVQVMNLAGQILSEVKNTKTIQMGNLPAGMYLIHIHTKNNLMTKKVIKK